MISEMTMDLACWLTLVFLVTSAGLSPTSRQRSPWACMKLILQFARVLARSVLVPRRGRRQN